MLIWLNGPFGGGKTQTAYELRRRLPGSLVCDPEQLGFGLHRMLPPSLRSDFQDLQTWRDGTVEVLDLVLRRHAGVVIVPMTVVEPAYFGETVGRLRDRGHDIRHVALLADRATVLRRLRERALGHVLAPRRGENFAVARLDLCLERLRLPLFAEQVWNDEISVAQVADRVAELCGLDLLPAQGPLRGRLTRAWVGVRHIRL